MAVRALVAGVSYGHMVALSKTMRDSFAIAPKVLLKFNEMVPAGERSQVIHSLMQRALAERQKRLEAIAEDFDTHSDFRIARGEGAAFEMAVDDEFDK
jgi:hypothetical protein